MRSSFDLRSDRTVWPEEPVLIVSADSHASAAPEDYVKYLDPKYREHFDTYLEDQALINWATGTFGYPFPPDVLEIIDHRRALESGGETGAWDPHRRLREAEREGVAAEFLHPFGNHSFTPFFDVMSRPTTGELRAAGARAHNRFLLDFCSAAPGRLLGVPCIYPWPDWSSAIADIERAREAGSRAIYPPQTAGVEGDLPAMYDPWWDPLWAACQDLGMAVQIHAGFGNAQGMVRELVQQAQSGAHAAAGDGQASINRFDVSLDQQESQLAEAFATFVERRPLWQLMYGGAFDRFPRLKVAFAEIHGDWVPPTLKYLDARHAKGGTPLKLKPSEYWQRHCAVGASLMRHGEVRARHEIGVDKLMFGTDFAHMEGTWPNTWDWIRTTLGEIPEDEARQILAFNAVEFYDLDRELLQRTARRIGPFPSQIFGHHEIPREVWKHFHFRAGINKDADFDEVRLAAAVDEDEQGAQGARSTVGAS